MYWNFLQRWKHLHASPVRIVAISNFLFVCVFFGNRNATLLFSFSFVLYDGLSNVESFGLLDILISSVLSVQSSNTIVTISHSSSWIKYVLIVVIWARSQRIFFITIISSSSSIEMRISIIFWALSVFVNPCTFITFLNKRVGTLCFLE